MFSKGSARKQRKIVKKKPQSLQMEISLSKKDIHDIERIAEQTALNFNVEALMTCFALSLNDLYGFGETRIIRTLDNIDRRMADIVNDTKTVDDFKAELKAKTGVAIITSK